MVLIMTLGMRIFCGGHCHSGGSETAASPLGYCYRNSKGAGDGRNLMLKCYKHPQLWSRIDCVSGINAFQFFVYLWLVFRVLKWWFFRIVLSSFHHCFLVRGFADSSFHHSSTSYHIYLLWSTRKRDYIFYLHSFFESLCT